MTIHNKGGSREPYEKYHLTDKAHDDVSHVATSADDGLMSGALFAQNQQVTTPASSTASGESGQWANDTEYLYYCLEPNTWIRLKLEPILELGWLLIEGDIPEHDHPYAFEQGPEGGPPEEGYGWQAEPF